MSQSDPNGTGAPEVIGAVVDLAAYGAVAEHLADDLGLLLAKMVVTDRAPDALVPDLDPPRVLPLAVGQSDLERGGAHVGVLVGGVLAVGDAVADVVDVYALLVGAVPLELLASLGRLAAPEGKSIEGLILEGNVEFRTR